MPPAPWNERRDDTVSRVTARGLCTNAWSVPRGVCLIRVPLIKIRKRSEDFWRVPVPPSGLFPRCLLSPLQFPSVLMTLGLICSFSSFSKWTPRSRGTALAGVLFLAAGAGAGRVQADLYFNTALGNAEANLRPDRAATAPEGEAGGRPGRSPPRAGSPRQSSPSHWETVHTERGARGVRRRRPGGGVAGGQGLLSRVRPTASAKSRLCRSPNPPSGSF